MEKQILITKLGYLLDSTKMGHVKWAENERGIYDNKTNKTRVAGYAVEIAGDFTNECEDMRTRLFKAAQKSAVANNKTYDELQAALRLKFKIDWGSVRQNERPKERYI